MKENVIEIEKNHTEKNRLEEFLENPINSTLREQIVEYKLLSELLIYSATKGEALEILRAEHDSFGYDIVLKIRDEIRYIQLKAKLGEGRTLWWKIHKSLINSPHGTVLVAYISYVDNNIKLHFKALSLLDENIRSKVVNQTHNKIQNKVLHCKVSERNLQAIENIDKLYEFLFNKKL